MTPKTEVNYKQTCSNFTGLWERNLDTHGDTKVLIQTFRVSGAYKSDPFLK